MRNPPIVRLFFCALSIAFLAGCTTTHNIHGFRGKGKSATFDVAFMDAWESAKEAGNMMGLDIKEENLDAKYIVFGKRVSLMSYGEVVGVYVTPVSDGKARVEVVSKPKVRTNIFAPNWEDKYLESLTSLIHARQR
ncbi:MAG TPA: hypothetical protein VL688_06095 [Verrucomicrobiae bacterium]|jgi:hypothetical protein|nr:hypothetical protein [Verrucomicrobiae bacterium]